MKGIFLSLISISAMSLFAGISISEVQVLDGHSRQVIKISYVITGHAGCPLQFAMVARDNETGVVYDCRTLEGVDTTPGKHCLVWQAVADGARFRSNDVVFNLRLVQPLYYVADLSEGPSASCYPVAALTNEPNGGWSDEYKTTRIVLRRIDSGSFKMQNQHDVMLTKPFYIGVFEVTQKQYELVMGSNPSPADRQGDMRPCECVSYNMIRGHEIGTLWPENNAVDSESFLGRLRSRTGLDFDLPTEARWEYACRAGTTSDYNNGGSSEDDLKSLGRYWGNGKDGIGGFYYHTVVGSYLPNAWGLYDMHGNVWEWCLDWYGKTGTATDPKGPSAGGARVYRGGCWSYEAKFCTSSYRNCEDPEENNFWIGSSAYTGIGFRLSLDGECLGVGSEDTCLVEVETGSVSVDTVAEGAPECEIVLDANGGSPALTSLTRYRGFSYGVLPVACSSCDFMGWFTEKVGGVQITEESEVASDCTLYAHWGHVSDWLRGGGLDVSSRVRRMCEPQRITMDSAWGDGGVRTVVSVDGVETAKSRGADEFVWSGDETKEYTLKHQVYDVQGRAVGEPYTAKIAWTSRAAVTFDGGNGEEAFSREYDKSYAYGELPSVTKTGHTFAGWYTAAEGGEKVEAGAQFDGSVSKLYAHWTVNQYGVKFDKNGGEGTAGDLTVVYGDVVPMEGVAFRKSGYRLAGWASAADGAAVYGQSGAMSNLTAEANGSVQLYAVWEPTTVDLKSFRQRYPWNGFVDVECEAGAEGRVGLLLIDEESGTNFTAKTLFCRGGSVTNSALWMAEGPQKFIWDAGSDLPDGFKTSKLKAKTYFAEGEE